MRFFSVRTGSGLMTSVRYRCCDVFHKYNQRFLTRALWAHKGPLPFLCLQTTEVMLASASGGFFLLLPLGSPLFLHLLFH